MFTLDQQVVVVKTGSFANWITAAAAVATFAVVAKTAKKIVQVFIEPLEPEVEEEVEETQESSATTEPKAKAVVRTPKKDLPAPTILHQIARAVANKKADRMVDDAIHNTTRFFRRK